MNFKLLIVLLVTALVSAGCGKVLTYKYYAFTSPVVQSGSSEIHARFRGKREPLVDYTAVLHGPYELLLWFVIENVDKKHTNCTLAFSSITLKDIENSETVFIVKNYDTAFKHRSDGVFRARFNYRYLDLEYTDHELQFFYTLGGSCRTDSSPTQVIIKLEKEYSEETMSVWQVFVQN